MELSAVINKYDLPLTRAERNLVARLPASASALSEDQYDRRMKELQIARDVLSRLPDRQTSERRSKMEKAAMLKERLKMLRQMIPFMSSSAAKSLKSEMKQIAAQLASLETESGGGGGGMMSAGEATASEPSNSGKQAKAGVDSSPANETDQADDSGQKVRRLSTDYALQGNGVKNADSNADVRQLKETIAELKKLFKTVLEVLKRKQAGRGSGSIQAPGTSLQAYAAIPDSSRRIVVKV